MISLPRLLCIHRTYMVLANSTTRTNNLYQPLQFPWNLLKQVCNHSCIVKTNFALVSDFLLRTATQPNCKVDRGLQLYVGLARTVYTRIYTPHIWWFPSQKYRMYTVYIWFWPILVICTAIPPVRRRNYFNQLRANRHARPAAFRNMNKLSIMLIANNPYLTP